MEPYGVLILQFTPEQVGILCNGTTLKSLPLLRLNNRLTGESLGCVRHSNPRLV